MIKENLEEEIWIENNGYKISNKGKVIGKKGKPIGGKLNKCGYVTCHVKFKDGFTTGLLHRAVAYAFFR